MSMSLFGSILGNMDEDPFFGSAMRHMTSMDHMMSSMIQDPFGMSGLLRDFGSSRSSMHNLMPPFGMPMMPNFGRVLGGSMGAIGSPMAGNCNFSSSSTVISMTSGPDGRPQVYKATSSTKVAPGGIKETQRTVTDSVSGTKKMEIGHHIGDRAHIIEKEQNLHTGDREEREDFINLDEEEAEDFNKEWATKTRSVSDLPRLTAAPARNRQFGAHNFGSVPAITAGYRSGSTDTTCTVPLVSARRSIRPSKSSQSSVPGSSHSSQRTPYRAPGQEKHRKSKNIKIVSGTTTDKTA